MRFYGTLPLRLVPLLLWILPAGSSFSANGSICNVEYCFPSSDERIYAASEIDLARQFEEHVEKTKSQRHKAEAYLNLGKAIERNYSYHYLAVDMYRRAIEFASEKKRGRAITSEARQRLASIGGTKFEVLREQLVLPNLRRVKRPIVIGKVLSHTQDRIDENIRELRVLLDQTPKGYRGDLKLKFQEQENGIIREFRFPELVDIRNGLLVVDGCGDPQSRCTMEAEDLDFAAAYRPGLELRYRSRIWKLIVGQTWYQVDVSWNPDYNKDSFDLNVPVRHSETDIKHSRWHLHRYYWRVDHRLGNYSLSERLAILDRFIRRFPEYEGRGKLLVDDIMFAHAVQEDKLVLFQEYVATFSDPKHREEALTHIERKRWEQAQLKDTLEGYAAFTSLYPESKFHSEVGEAVERLRFEAAKLSRSIDSLLLYLEQYPGGTYSSEAVEEIDRLRFLEIRSENTIASYQAFMLKYPESRFLKDCEQGIEAIRAGESFNAALASDTRDALLSFLKDFPNSSFVPEAKAKVAFFEARESRTLASCEFFFQRYREARAKKGLREDYLEVLDIVADLATADQSRRDSEGAVVSVAPLIVFHQEVWVNSRQNAHLDHLRGATELAIVKRIFRYAVDATEQSYALENFDSEYKARFFVPTAVDTDGQARVSWEGLFGTVKVESIEPTMTLAFKGDQLLKGEYVVVAEIELDIAYVREWKGGLPLAAELASGDSTTQQFTETYSSHQSFRISANETVSPVYFEFPKIEQSRCKEGVSFLIGSCKRGTLSGQRIKIRSVSRVQ